jgi:hypothetical protein
MKIVCSHEFIILIGFDVDKTKSRFEEVKEEVRKLLETIDQISQRRCRHVLFVLSHENITLN